MTELKIPLLTQFAEQYSKNTNEVTGVVMKNSVLCDVAPSSGVSEQRVATIFRVEEKSKRETNMKQAASRDRTLQHRRNLKEHWQDLIDCLKTII
jgi:hypothetical protein